MSKENSTPIRATKLLQDRIIIPASPFLKKIGYGTGVAVYEFKRSPLHDKVRSPWAIKKLINKKLKDKELDKRLTKEAAILKQLNHPNIVGFRAFVKSGNTDVLAMEECTFSLGDLIEERAIADGTPYPVKIISKVSNDVCLGLNYLHNEALLLHCDLKSFNILINGDFETCKICDFGVCLSLNTDGSLNLDKAEDAEYVGTPAWSAPEILNYPQDITTKADIYSFGLILWEMIALSVPIDEELMNSFEDESSDYEKDETSISAIRVRQRPNLPNNISMSEDYNVILEIMHNCTNSNKNDRPETKDLMVMCVKLYKQFMSEQ